MDDFTLDTKNMNDVISKIQNLADKTEDMNATFQTMLSDSTQEWKGKARTMFDKKAYVLTQQLSDVTQSLFDIAEELINASTTYMQADTEISKAADGINNRY